MEDYVLLFQYSNFIPNYTRTLSNALSIPIAIGKTIEEYIIRFCECKYKMNLNNNQQKNTFFEKKFKYFLEFINNLLKISQLKIYNSLCISTLCG